MSNRLLNRFVRERVAGRKLFVPFITAGDRGLEFTAKAILALDQAGADAVELGVPFSDPIADGKVIQVSSQRALVQHTTLLGILHMVQSVRMKTNIPILLMGYLNPFLNLGPKKVAQTALHSGVDGLIIPDLPPEEANEWLLHTHSYDIDMVFLTTPNSTEERLKAVARVSTGYIYYVSVTGTTGARVQLPRDLQAGIQRVRDFTPLPVLVGFGISTPRQATQVASIADGVIVGSAMVNAMSGPVSDATALKQLGRLAQQMTKAIKKD